MAVQPAALVPAVQATTTLETPLGRLTLFAAEQGLWGAYFMGQRNRPAIAVPDAPQHPVLASATQAYSRWFAGEEERIEIPRMHRGTALQVSVWDQLQRVPLGTTTTYKRIAEAIGKPTAVRAVAGAIGANPWIVMVPCHRVVGESGALTGFSAGLERKSALLAFEREWVARRSGWL